jgi:GxxExxY protein
LCLRSENPLSHEFKKKKWKIWIKKILLGFLFKKINIFFYIGEENKEFLKFYGADESKMVFTPYAIDNDFFREEYKKLKDKKDELRKELNIPPNAIVILFVGKLIEKKRPMDLLKAYEATIRMIQMRANITNNITNDKIIEKNLSYKLNGIFFKIHNILGRFAREKQYADALEQELKSQKIRYKREALLDVFGKKTNIADFIIEDKILIEIKRKPVNTKEDYKQIMRYLQTTGLELGILVNFGLEYLKPKRILNYKLKHSDEFENSDTFGLNSDYGLYLVFVGEGPLRKEIETYIKEKNLKNVFITGFISQAEIPKYYAIADIFVLPSGVGETWGLVVNEAMNFGLPVIVSDLVGCGKDLVKHGENGYIFKFGDIDELTNYLRDLIIDENKRIKFIQKSFAIVIRYSYNKDVEEFIKVLK